MTRSRPDLANAIRRVKTLPPRTQTKSGSPNTVLMLAGSWSRRSRSAARSQRAARAARALICPSVSFLAPVLVETIQRVRHHPPTSIAADQLHEHLRVGAQLVGRQVQPHVRILPARPGCPGRSRRKGDVERERQPTQRRSRGRPMKRGRSRGRSGLSRLRRPSRSSHRGVLGGSFLANARRAAPLDISDRFVRCASRPLLYPTCSPGLPRLRETPEADSRASTQAGRLTRGGWSDHDSYDGRHRPRPAHGHGSIGDGPGTSAEVDDHVAPVVHTAERDEDVDQSQVARLLLLDGPCVAVVKS